LGPHPLNLVLETAEALVAAVLAFVMIGRLRLGAGRAGRRDLLLAVALAVLAANGALLVAVGVTAGGWGAHQWVFSAALANRLAAGAVAAFAAVAGDRAVRAGRPGVLVALAAPAIVGAVAVARPDLPTRPLQFTTAAVFIIAAVGFLGAARRSQDGLLPWIAACCAMTAAARVADAVDPVSTADALAVADVLRLGAYGLLLVGLVRQVGAFWERAVRAATLDERRRVARELHDGLAQELAFIAVEAKRLDGAAPGLEHAAQRALDEARAAVNALTMGSDEPFPAALAAAAEDVTLRSGARLEVELPVEPLDVSVDARQALVRIVREAVANATRHGGAETIRLTVERVGRPPMLRIRVVDDGAGFDVPDALAARRGFGLQSIRERAEGLGGSVRITSAAGAGTQVEVTVP